MRSLIATLTVLLYASTILVDAQKTKREGKKRGRASGNQMTALDRKMLADVGDILAPARCVRIPSNFTMCHGLGYEHMRLPTVLQHDTVESAISMSRDFLTMLRLKCHPHLRMFLCTLFSSICLPGQPELELKPCQPLCQQIRDQCERNMTQYGYQWPALFNCSNFPTENPCVGDFNDVVAKDVDTDCVACTESYELSNVVNKACEADIVMRTKRLRVETSGNRITVHANVNSKNVMRSALLLTPASQNLAMSIDEQACGCSRLDANESANKDYLLMIKRDVSTGRNVLTFIMNISAGDSNQQKMIKVLNSYFRNQSNRCPVSPGDLNSLHHRIHGSSANADATETNERNGRTASNAGRKQGAQANRRAAMSLRNRRGMSAKRER